MLFFFFSFLVRKKYNSETSGDSGRLIRCVRFPSGGGILIFEKFIEILNIVLHCFLLLLFVLCQCIESSDMFTQCPPKGMQFAAQWRVLYSTHFPNGFSKKFNNICRYIGCIFVDFLDTSAIHFY